MLFYIRREPPRLARVPDVILGANYKMQGVTPAILEYSYRSSGSAPLKY